MSREHFERIDHATVESGLVPKLNILFSERNLAVKFWVFDAYEEAVGMGWPVRTRYLLPLLSSADKELDFGSGNYPGLYVYESFSLDDRGGDIDIKFPLEQIDLEKIGSRLGMIQKRGAVLDKRPDWWIYEQTAVDMTQPWNLALDPMDPERSGNAKYWAAHVFGMEGIYLPYEKEKAGQGFVLEWDINSQSVARSLRMVVSALDQLKVTQ